METYKKLEKHYESLCHLRRIQGGFGWDYEVLAPKGSLVKRAEQSAELSSLVHEKSRQKVLGDWLEKASVEKLDSWQEKNLKKMKEQWQEANLFDDAFIRKFSLAKSRSMALWREAKLQNDWKSFESCLEEILDFSKIVAEKRAEMKNLDIYDACLDTYESGVLSETVDKLFLELKNFLIPKIPQILEKQKKIGVLHKTAFLKSKQREFLVCVMKALQFDFEKGRLDTATHPFCSAYKGEARVTTFYKENDLLQGLLAVIHETGHASYEMGLPEKWALQPVGSSLGMALHESQSLLFEMQLGRSKEFLSFVLPMLQNYFPEAKSWDLDNFYQKVIQVEKGFIRVASDEVTYPLHVILRYEIEKDLLRGALQVKDIPEAWNAKMKDYFGLSTRGNEAQGCLQDPHWAWAAWGYFPMYTLGALIAAQVFNQAQNSMKKSSIEKGELKPLFSWLESHIWSQGSFYNFDELLKKVTGKSLSTEDFQNHINTRYLA